MSKPELTFKQEQELTDILEAYRSNPSNSNKYRYELFAAINLILAQHSKETPNAND